MFETLTGRLNQIFDQLRRRGKLSEADVDAAMREVRLALLEADVHFSVVKTFIAKIRERAVGAEVSRALNPGQQVIKIVNEELIASLGESVGLNLTGPKPRVIMLVGLQGAGKTTAAGKLARLMKSKGERILLVAGDPYRPAAIKQLQQLGERLDVEVETDSSLTPPQLAKRELDRESISLTLEQLREQRLAHSLGFSAIARLNAAPMFSLAGNPHVPEKCSALLFLKQPDSRASISEASSPKPIYLVPLVSPARLGHWFAPTVGSQGTGRR